MIISLRTFINTTFFRVFALVIFRGYTRWIDSTPAKELLYHIGRGDLGNLTVTTTQDFTMSDTSDFMQTIKHIETLTQATNTTCNMMTNFGFLVPYLQSNTTQSTSSPSLVNSSTSSQSVPSSQGPTPAKQIILPVLNKHAQANTSLGLSFVQRPITTSESNVSSLFTFLKSFQPNNQELEAGITNIISSSNITLENASLEAGVLTLSIHSPNALDEATKTLINTILQQYYSQFSSIQVVKILYV